MTERDTARIILDLRARLRLLERDLRLAQREKQRALGRAKRAVDESRFLHGLLLLHGVDPEKARFR